MKFILLIGKQSFLARDTVPARLCSSRMYNDWFKMGVLEPHCDSPSRTRSNWYIALPCVLWQLGHRSHARLNFRSVCRLLFKAFCKMVTLGCTCGVKEAANHHPSSLSRFRLSLIASELSGRYHKNAWRYNILTGRGPSLTALRRIGFCRISLPWKFCSLSPTLSLCVRA